MASLGMRFFGNLEDWLDRRRVFACCGTLLAIEIGVFLFLVAGTHGLIVPLSQPTSTDFVSFYAAGSLADAGKPELAYDHAEHYAAEERATAAGVEYRRTRHFGPAQLGGADSAPGISGRVLDTRPGAERIS